MSQEGHDSERSRLEPGSRGSCSRWLSDGDSATAEANQPFRTAHEGAAGGSITTRAWWAHPTVEHEQAFFHLQLALTELTALTQ